MRRKNPKRVKAGKEAAKKRWTVRYDALIKLSAWYGKEHQAEFMRWLTPQLTYLVWLHETNQFRRKNG